MSQVSHVSRVFPDANKQLGPTWFDYEQLVIEWVSSHSTPRPATEGGGERERGGLGGRGLMMPSLGCREPKINMKSRGSWEGER